MKVKADSTSKAPRDWALVRQRRQEILESAAHLMQDAGYHAVTMQSVADTAGISVGLIYQYFGNKEDLLRAVIVDILEAFARTVPAAMKQAGDNPVERLSRGFRAFCEIIAQKPEGTVLAYRESSTLSREGRDELKDLEIRTARPLRYAVIDGIEAGLFSEELDPEIVVHNMVLAAHGWALKYWYLAPRFSLDEYIEQQLTLLLRSIRATP